MRSDGSAGKIQLHDGCILLLGARLEPPGHRHQGSAIQLSPCVSIDAQRVLLYTFFHSLSHN